MWFSSVVVHGRYPELMQRFLFLSHKEIIFMCRDLAVRVERVKAIGLNNLAAVRVAYKSDDGQELHALYTAVKDVRASFNNTLKEFGLDDAWSLAAKDNAVMSSVDDTEPIIAHFAMAQVCYVKLRPGEVRSAIIAQTMLAHKDTTITDEFRAGLHGALEKAKAKENAEKDAEADNIPIEQQPEDTP